MNLTHIRISFLLLTLLVLFSIHNLHLAYLWAMWISAEYLNNNKTFIKHKQHQSYNFIFWLFTVFVIVNRSRSVAFSPALEEFVNICEHFFYALVIGIKLHVYFRLLLRKFVRRPILWIFTSLNVIGFINEIFQNWLRHRPLLEFIADSKKDMLVNFVGSLVFVLVVVVMRRRNKLFSPNSTSTERIISM